MTKGARRPINRWLEPAFAVAILAGIIHAFWFLATQGYLPPPFFYLPDDTWMDWFNTAYWSHEPGAYDTWQTIYPPVSFVFMRLATYGPCYFDTDALSARDCDWYGLFTLHALFVLNIVLVAWSYYKIDRQTALPRSFAVTAGIPMLFALDRGNLVIPCFTCLVLAFGPLVRSARWRWLAVGIAVNFKVYLIASIFPQLLRGRWRWFEGAVTACVLVYLVTYLLLGTGSPGQIYENIANFAGLYEAGGFLDTWFATTYKPMISLLEADRLAVLRTVGSGPVETGLFLFPLMLRIAQLCIVLGAASAWLRPSLVPMHRLTFFGIALALITAEAGGYTQCFILFFVMQERWHGVGRKVAIVTAYLLCLPWELQLEPITSLVRNSTLTGQLVEIKYYVTLSPFLRPGLIMLMASALAVTTLGEVLADLWVSRRTPVPETPTAALA